MEHVFARIKFHIPPETQQAWIENSRKAGLSLGDWVVTTTECTSPDLPTADYNTRLAMAANSLMLSRKSIAALTTIGGMKTSESRAISWLIGFRESRDPNAKKFRNRPMTAEEFEAFLVGLKTYLNRLSLAL